MSEVRAKKSGRDGMVRLVVKLKAFGYGDYVSTEGSTDLTIGAARFLAQDLNSFADFAEAKVARKAARAERQQSAANVAAYELLADPPPSRRGDDAEERADG